VSASERIAEIKQRYGPDDLVTRFITDASAELLAAVERTEALLHLGLLGWSGRRESNPHDQLGRLGLCH
jgi:hypothetical protein